MQLLLPAGVKNKMAVHTKNETSVKQYKNKQKKKLRKNGKLTNLLKSAVYEI
jgi:hypothetical protein